jgi:hypothetical protein
MEFANVIKTIADILPAENLRGKYCIFASLKMKRMIRQALETEQKALEINLNDGIYGTATASKLLAKRSHAL